LPESLLLPEEAELLYTEIAFRLPQAIIARAKVKNKWLTVAEKNQIDALLDILIKLDKDNTVIKYIEQDRDNDAKRCTLEIQLTVGGQEEGYKSEWDYTVTGKSATGEFDGEAIDVNDNYLTADTSQMNGELLFKFDYKLLPNLSLFGTAGLGLLNGTNTQSAISRSIREGVPYKFLDTSESQDATDFYPILGLGVNWEILSRKALGPRLTLNSLQTGVDLNWKMRPHQPPAFNVKEGAETIYRNEFFWNGYTEAWFSPNGWENSWQLGTKLQGNFNWGNGESSQDAAGLGVKYQYGDFSASLIPSYVFKGKSPEKDEKDWTWNNDWGLDIGLTYKWFSLFGGLTGLSALGKDKEWNAYLKAQFQLNKALAFYINGSYYYGPGSVGEAMYKSETNDEGKPWESTTTTRTTDTTDPTKNWQAGIGLIWRF